MSRDFDCSLSLILSYLGTRRWYLYFREVSIYSTLERAPAMPNQACFRHIEAIIPTQTVRNRNNGKDEGVAK